MVEAGIITRDEAKHHHLRHMVTNVVGGGNEGVTADVHKMKLLPGDVLMLCSDGLTEVVPLENIASTLFADRNPTTAAKRLVDAANEGGGPDNITVVVATFESPRPAPRPNPKDGERLPPAASGWFPSGEDAGPATVRFDGPRGGIIGPGKP
jgi:serine/threonine protein phosphatase PrpC